METSGPLATDRRTADRTPQRETESGQAQGHVAGVVPVEEAVDADAALAGAEREVRHLDAGTDHQARRPLQRPIPAAFRQGELLERRAHRVSRHGTSKPGGEPKA